MLLRGRALALFALLLGPGCAAISCEADPPARAPSSSPRDPTRGVWPVATRADLPLATPATRVTAYADGTLEVSNEALVGSWPETARERARAEAPTTPGWPVVRRALLGPRVEGMTIASLQQALVEARAAERAATGAGSGAGVFDLKVEGAVPVGRVEAIFYTAAQVGYGAPRIVLAAEPEERALPWPSAPPRRGPTREAIEAALRDPTLGLPIGGEAEPRLELGADRLRVGDAALDLEPAGLERALAGVEGPLTLSVAGAVPFARLASVLQALHPRAVRLDVTR